jgi:hypothetical protein
MVEIFGARGQDLTYPEMKWWADHMHVSGVNFLIPHSFNPRGPRDTDCPPYFYNGGFEPRWPLYRVFADYTSRLSLMLTGGRHVCPVALLFPGQAVHVGRHILPEQVSEALQDSLYDCDWIPADVFEQGMTLAGRQLRLRDESYRILFMPAAEAISVPTLVKAGEFFEQGGVVVAYGMLPSKSATLGRTAAEVARIRDAIWGDARPGLAVCRVSAAGGRSYLLPAQPTPEQLQQVLAGDAGVRPTLEVIEGRTDHWLHVLHRVKAGRDVFFIANQNCQGPAREFRLRITAKGEPNGWDAMRNETAPLPHRRSGEQVDLALTMEPLESVLLVFEDKPRPASPRVETRDSRRHVVMDVARDPDAAPARAATPPDSGPVGRLEGGAWVWYPDDPASTTAPPGTRCFRKEIEIPAGRKLKNATFAATADNSLVLHVNGKTAGRSDDSGEGWRNPVEISVRDFLHEGRNTLAIVAVNATDRPSPAGVLGRLQVEFQDGSSLGVRVDKSWKTSRQAPEGWMAAGFDDSAWAPAREVARFGEGIWGRLNARLTLSPVKADPFAGHFELPGSVTLPASRVYLEMADVQPETAARVTVNDQDAGGFIGAPMRIDIAPYLKSGVNTIRIEPFAPRRVQLVTY